MTIEVKILGLSSEVHGAHYKLNQNISLISKTNDSLAKFNIFRIIKYKPYFNLF
jgi:hypothetical protein